MARITATETDFWEGRTDDSSDITQHDIDMGNARKCEACNTTKFLNEQRQCPDTLNWYCIACINDGTMEDSVSNWFNGTITEYKVLIGNLKIGRTGVNQKNINYIK